MGAMEPPGDSMSRLCVSQWALLVWVGLISEGNWCFALCPEVLAAASLSWLVSSSTLWFLLFGDRLSCSSRLASIFGHGGA